MGKVYGWMPMFIVIILAVLFVSCGPGYTSDSTYVEPVVNEPKTAPETVFEGEFTRVLSKDISMDFNMQMMDKFTQGETMVMEKLDVAAMDQDKNSGFGSGDLKVNWGASQMAYKQDADKNLIIDVVAAPVQSEYLNPEKIQTMMAAGEMPEEVTVGAVALLSDYSDLNQGEYLLVWNPGIDEVCIRDPDTGVCTEAEYCIDSDPVGMPFVTMTEGSVEICVSFDSRRCCVTFGK